MYATCPGISYKSWPSIDWFHELFYFFIWKWLHSIQNSILKFTFANKLSFINENLWCGKHKWANDLVLFTPSHSHTHVNRPTTMLTKYTQIMMPPKCLLCFCINTLRKVMDPSIHPTSYGLNSRVEMVFANFYYCKWYFMSDIFHIVIPFQWSRC